MAKKNTNDLLSGLVEALKSLLPSKGFSYGAKTGPLTATAGYNPQTNSGGAGLGVNGYGPNISVSPQGIDAGIGNPDDARPYGQQFLDTVANQQTGSRFNPLAQARAVMGMNPQMAQSYRQQVDQTVPKADFGDVPVASGLAEGIANGIPNAVAGMAKLPAARTFQQGAGDVVDIGVGALEGAGLLDAAKTGMSALMRNPDMVTNQRGGVDLQYKYSPEGNLQKVSKISSKTKSPEVQALIDKINGRSAAFGDSSNPIQELKNHSFIKDAVAKIPDADLKAFVTKKLSEATTLDQMRGPLSALNQYIDPAVRSYIAQMLPSVDQLFSGAAVGIK